MPVELLSNADERFGRLSPKERELLDHILQHKSLKVIAHDLGVTPSAVDQRLKSARLKLGAVDRNDAARRYSALLEHFQQKACPELVSGWEPVLHPEMRQNKDLEHCSGAAGARNALAGCRESTYGFAELGGGGDAPLFQPSELAAGSTFTFQDSATINVAPPWFEHGHTAAVSEVLDEKFGRAWRVVAIPVLAVLIAVLALALIAMAKSLGELL